ncbi:Crp/Fnr family transcriptional regulator [Chryseobacterium gambrini]|uniref:Crp/Fnr family transcriptional regulator n=1 Tax=Chryseobacterium gambrini TaxID=373672 RepID=UPI0022F390FE|nr:Crp/Fnr family transcriptional regulator [Chryseobacterium gambrini]WBX97846.1 Crp/Fnr family transcriptional regulator [Chryseobacterium gambrini]
MIIDEKILRLYGGEDVEVNAREILFSENTTPEFYYQVKVGIIKLINIYSKTEFIHTYISEGECLGENFLITQTPYTLRAVANEKSIVTRLPRFQFMEILAKYSTCNTALLQLMAKRMCYKDEMMFAISSNNPKVKIMTLLKQLKESQSQGIRVSYEIPLTRKEISNMLGIRVETVIRCIKSLENNGMVSIVNGKIQL